MNNTNLDDIENIHIPDLDEETYFSLSEPKISTEQHL